MRNVLDFAPYRRSLIGFDHLFNLLENAATPDNGGSPLYDVEQAGEDAYRIHVSLAGYKANDIDVTVHQNVLVVSGRKQEKTEARNYLFRSISTGDFERRFQLADHVQVTSATLTDGLLQIDLKREVPEAAKPRKIAIGHAADTKRLEASSPAQAA